jgi:hypothetical protein
VKIALLSLATTHIEALARIEQCDAMLLESVKMKRRIYSFKIPLRERRVHGKSTEPSEGKKGDNITYKNFISSFHTKS